MEQETPSEDDTVKDVLINLWGDLSNWSRQAPWVFHAMGPCKGCLAMVAETFLARNCSRFPLLAQPCDLTVHQPW